MRKFILIAAMAVGCAAAAQAGDSRSLSVAGMDEKLPAALGKAAGAPKIVEAPKPPDPPKPPEPAKAAETAKPSEEPKTDQAPQFVARPAVGKKAEPAKTNSSKDGQVTFEEKKPAAAKDNAAVEAKPATEAQDKPAVENAPAQKTAKADKPRRKRSHHWNEARIMRELHRYGVMAGGWGGW
jgi:hypothetical protein